MRSRVRGALQLVWKAVNDFFADGCPGMAAALSFYTFFSLPALLVLLLLVVGAFLDPEVVQAALVEQVRDLLGRAGAEQVETVLQRARRPEMDVSAAALLGVAAVLFGATTAFAQLQEALNRAWSVQPDPGRGQIRTFLAKRVFSFGVVLVVAFLLLVSLALSTALAAFGGALAAGLPGPASEPMLRTLNFVFSFGVFALLFAAMFRLIPDAEVAWADVWVGALATALLFVLGKLLIGTYLGRTDPGSAYGAAGSLAVVLLWVYYSSMIVLFGAELTRAWADRYGKGVEPTEGAVEIVG